MKVTITDSPHLIPAAVPILQAAGVEVVVGPEGADPAQIAALASDSDAVMALLMPFDAAALAALERPRLLVRCGIGFDTIDLEAAADQGIAVANVPDYCVSEVADHTMALMLHLLRRLDSYRVRSGDPWSTRVTDPVSRLDRLTVGIVGLGRIGSAVTVRSRAFGMRVVACEPTPTTRDTEAEILTLDELLATSDVVTLHCPHTSETEGIISTQAVEKMKPGTVLINTARGPLVDLDAIHAGLEVGKLAGVGLDVVPGEPRPDLAHPIFTRDEVVVTSHMAWYSETARQELGRKAAENVISYLQGNPPSHVVNGVDLQAGG